MRTVDFMRSHSAPMSGWCLLVAGAAALSGALWIGQGWARVRADREAAQEIHRQAREDALRAAQRPQAPTPEQLRMRAVAPMLRQPWLPTLRVIENVTEPPVHLLGLAIDPAAGTVRLEGEAGSFDQVLTYVRSLDDGDLLGPAYLRAHETLTDPAGRAYVRFTVTTQWRSR